MRGSHCSVYDPGGDDYNPEELCMIADLLELTIPDYMKGVVSITKGQIIHGDLRVPLERVLWDSGAMHSSYLSQKVVDEHRDQWMDKIYEAKGFVRLGDGETTINVKERIAIEVAFIDSVGGEYRATVDFCIWETPDLDAIIGLPDIVHTFLPCFVDILTPRNEGQTAVTTMAETSSADDILLDLEEGKLLEPWTSTLDPADEELEVDDPCSFTQPLYFITKSREEIQQDYDAWKLSNISEDWRSRKQLMDLLETPEAREVFMPMTWRGIQGMEPVELEFSSDLPREHNPTWRWLNPKVREPAMKELSRLCDYMYVDLDSPIASPLVVAPKATSPFVRICGDYVWINKYIASPHYFIPHVSHELDKAATSKFYMDLDMANAFHQIPLAKTTSQRLSVTTPIGLKRPVFLPEGVSPASGLLQRTVMSLFADFSEWTICLFDNILVLCDSFEDAMVKLRKIIQRCYERSVVLKFSKSFLGFQTCKFFGYRVSPGKYEMDEDRKKDILEAPMPTSLKSMQRFLGAAIFFSEFVPGFASLVSKLYDMTVSGFNWDKTKWEVDYEAEFSKVKRALAESTAKYFPDYSAPWVLRTDASNEAVSAVLFQVITDATGKEVHHPIGFKSKKFSGPARVWDTFKKECYGIFYGVKAFSYYLLGKPFTIETDHNNLVWMEQSEAHIVVRWRIYMQSFQFLIRHIKGKDNIVADWGSRMYSLQEDDGNVEEEFQPELTNDESKDRSPDFYIGQVHGGRMLHHGARKTWLRLNKYFPGHLWDDAA